MIYKLLASIEAVAGQNGRYHTAGQDISLRGGVPLLYGCQALQFEDGRMSDRTISRL